jgi:tetratricopeptide (TPR) repeat protein
MRIAALALVLVVAVSPLARAASPLARAEDGPSPEQGEAERKARDLYAQGEAAFKAGRYDEALTEFEAGFAAVPRAGFVLNIGHVYRKTGKLWNARSAYKKYLLMEPDSKFRDNVLAVIAEIDSALAEEERAEVPVESPARSIALAPPPTAPAPALLAVSPTIQARGRDGARPAPLYRRAWFWVAVGAVVVGAGAGIYLWRRPAEVGYQSSGSLGALGP